MAPAAREAHQLGPLEPALGPDHDRGAAHGPRRQLRAEGLARASSQRADRAAHRSRGPRSTLARALGRRHLGNDPRGRSAWRLPRSSPAGAGAARGAPARCAPRCARSRVAPRARRRARSPCGDALHLVALGDALRQRQVQGGFAPERRAREEGAVGEAAAHGARAAPSARCPCRRKPRRCRPGPGRSTRVRCRVSSASKVTRSPAMPSGRMRKRVTLRAALRSSEDQPSSSPEPPSSPKPAGSPAPRSRPVSSCSRMPPRISAPPGAASRR